MGDFRLFSQAVAAQFADMSKGELFVVDVNDIYETYLAAFPEGTNPIFRTRTEHDCSCCKNFIRNLGTVVALDPSGNIRTVWDDFPTLDEPYGTVARTLAGIVRQAPIKTVYRTRMGKYGEAVTREQVEDTVRNWNHFVGNIASKHRSDDADTVRGQIDAAAQVLRRGLDELTLGSIDTVLDLINEGALYRGDEHKAATTAFRALKASYDASLDKTMFVWANIENRAARFRNTVIGTLVTDIATGVELERAVKSFETKVAPANYKRSSALITSKMVDSAMATLKELNLEDAVHRRFAKLSDVSVNDVLFVDNAARPQMQDSLSDVLKGSIKAEAPRNSAKVDIPASEFFDRIVPAAASIEVLVQNKHAGNFMSMTAPVTTDTGKLFKWDNDFAWSYDGEVTDSIKARVKAAGGNVSAKMRVSLAWFNSDDLDIHCRTPRGEHIYFGNKGNILDVDMNAGGHHNAKDPVENLAFGSLSDGPYYVEIHQFSKRNTKNVGFALEVEIDGVIQQFSYDREVRSQQTVKALTLTVLNGKLVSISTGTGVVGGTNSSEKWGVNTETFVPVETLVASPNHWNGQEIGNKHWFFLLRGCKNPEPVRGIYNEFLRSTLDKHRKVFEVLGSKTKCEVTDEQLSGVGFSSNRGDTVTVRVDGRRTYNLTF